MQKKENLHPVEACCTYSTYNDSLKPTNTLIFCVIAFDFKQCYTIIAGNNNQLQEETVMTLPIGEKIRMLRLHNKLTQEQLADRVGVSYQSVSRWENGGSLN